MSDLSSQRENASSVEFPDRHNLNQRVKDKLHYRANTDDDRWIVAELLEQDMYRFEHLAALEPDEICAVIDCGAHIGVFTLLAQAHFRQVEIHAFEPQPNNFALLQANAAGQAGIVLHAEGVGPHDADVKLYRPVPDDGFSGRWSVTPPASQETGDYETIRVIDLNQFILALDKAVFILKLDLEGYESEIVQHLSTEALSRIKLLILEEHHVPIDHAKLRQHGYTLDFRPFNSDRHFVYYNRFFWKFLADRNDSTRNQLIPSVLEYERDQVLQEMARLSLQLENIYQTAQSLRADLSNERALSNEQQALIADLRSALYQERDLVAGLKSELSQEHSANKELRLQIEQQGAEIAALKGQLEIEQRRAAEYAVFLEKIRATLGVMRLP